LDKERNKMNILVNSKESNINNGYLKCPKCGEKINIGLENIIKNEQKSKIRHYKSA